MAIDDFNVLVHKKKLGHLTKIYGSSQGKFRGLGLFLDLFV
jgi:hypothetical protein